MEHAKNEENEMLEKLQMATLQKQVTHRRSQFPRKQLTLAGDDHYEKSSDSSSEHNQSSALSIALSDESEQREKAKKLRKRMVRRNNVSFIDEVVDKSNKAAITQTKKNRWQNGGSGKGIMLRQQQRQ